MSAEGGGWVRISNDLGASDKALELGHYLESIGLLVCVLGYCDRQRTDGRVPKRAFGKAIAPGCRTTALVADLLNAGFLEPDGDDYRVHNYLEWQRSAEQIAAASAKGKAGAAARWNPPSNAPSNAAGNADKTRQTRQEERRRDETDQTVSDAEVAQRQIDRVTREHGPGFASQVAPILHRLVANHGRHFAADAVDRLLASRDSVKQPAHFLIGIEKKMLAEQEPGITE